MTDQTKTALVLISSQALSRLIGLPEGARVDAIFQRSQDLASDSFSIRVRGAGRAVPEGSQAQYYELSELAKVAVTNEVYEMESFCDNCQTETLQKIKSGGHERDSSNDIQICMVCGRLAR